MRKSNRLIAGVAVLAVTASAALAGTASAAPDGKFAFKATGTPNSENASVVGQLSSQITQNGQFVSGQDNAYDVDQTTTPGSRAAGVQDLLGH